MIDMSPAALDNNLGFARPNDSFYDIRAAVSRWFRSFYYGFATARLMRVMNSMTDDQLSRIGVTRDKIPERAASIMKSEA